MVQFVKGSAAVGVAFFTLASFSPALDSEHKGPARVIDAGTIEVGGGRHRFYGIDAVEIDRVCRHRDGTQWPCGREAAAALAELLRGRTVNCDIWQGTVRDAHDRFVSVCYAGSDNLSTWVANEGWALADRDANRLYNYTTKEGMVKFLRRGVWAGPFDPPKEWRRQAGERP